MRDFCAEGYGGSKARYVGPDGATSYQGNALSVGDLIPDPSGLNAIKAPDLFAPDLPAEPAKPGKRKGADKAEE